MQCDCGTCDSPRSRAICDAIRTAIARLAEARFVELRDPAATMTCAFPLDDIGLDSLATIAFLSQLECELAAGLPATHRVTLDEPLDAAMLRGITTIGSLARRIATILDERAACERGGQ
jgi:acyl carrier protein